MTREECKEMIMALCEKRMLLFNEPIAVEDTIMPMNDYLSGKYPYEIRVKPNNHAHVSWELITIYVEDLSKGKIVHRSFTDRIHIIPKLKEVFASIIIDDLDEGY